MRGRFLERTRAEWEAVFAGLDACVTPVLEMDEAREFTHNKEREAFRLSDQGKWDPVR